MSRIALVTAGHLSTCPRMRKAADALAAAGHEVRWVYASRTPRWAALDRAMLRGARWTPRPVRLTGPLGTARRWSLRWARAPRGGAGPGAAEDLAALCTARDRVHPLLVAALREEPFSLVLGGTEGGMGAAFEAARGAGVPLALDLEDLYSRSRGAADPSGDGIARRVEEAVIPAAAVRFAPSEGVAAAYDARFAGRTVVVHNVLPLPDRAPEIPAAGSGPLRLCWIGQTAGADRGLEEAVDAAALSGVPVDLAVLARPVDGFRRALEGRARAGGGRVRLSWSAPVAPDAVVDWCRGREVGLCLERTEPANRGLTLSNKALTYPLAGAALLLTDTPGQRLLEADLGPGASFHGVGDREGMAARLASWHGDRGSLAAARRAAWEGMRGRWHWDHPLERGAFLAAVKAALRGAPAGGGAP